MNEEMDSEDKYLLFKEISDLTETVLEKLLFLKPNDRSLEDRNFAICFTEFKKAKAFYEYWIMPEE